MKKPFPRVQSIPWVDLATSQFHNRSLSADLLDDLTDGPDDSGFEPGESARLGFQRRTPRPVLVEFRSKMIRSGPFSMVFRRRGWKDATGAAPATLVPRSVAVWGLDSLMRRPAFMVISGRCFLAKPLLRLPAECPDAAGYRHGMDCGWPLRLTIAPLRGACRGGLRTPASCSESGRAAAGRR